MITIKATHQGVLTVGPAKMPCAVLADGRRVFSTAGVLGALGTTQPELALLIPQRMRAKLLDPIAFLSVSGEPEFGYDALFVKAVVEGLLASVANQKIADLALAGRVVDLVQGLVLASASVGQPRH